MLTISPVKIVRTGSRLQCVWPVHVTCHGGLLTSSEYFAIATADNTRKFLSFEDVDYEAKSTKEERVSAAAKAAAEGGRIGAGDTGTVVSTSANGGGTVTVTVYNNNGLWQRIKRWWLKLISSEERASSASAVTSGEGGRAGQEELWCPLERQRRWHHHGIGFQQQRTLPKDRTLVEETLGSSGPHHDQNHYLGCNATPTIVA
ncbi:hypothetical protein GQ600_15615 [Phytophthora cactorum]|nr:hypothetical protein GQ600_15615 [Phytophthora cactorum]